uniref:F-box domain-containing protein n=2 Tax=Dunaliella tertiolecta TaxID=3047 RepID=A0A6S8L5N2_DUNTE
MQYLPGPLLQGLSGYLSSQDLLRARLVCKYWHEHLVAGVPVCIVVPVDANALESGSALLPCAHSAVLALDEVHLEKLQRLSSRSAGSLSSAPAPLLGQLELLGKTCSSLRGLRLLFQPAVVQMYNPDTDHWLSAACSLWLGKVFHKWTSLSLRLRQLHIAVGSMQAPDSSTLAHALQLPCLEDFLLSCKHITSDHALVIAQMTGLRALSLHDKHKSSSTAWWAASPLRASPPSLQRLTSLVLDSPGLTVTEGVPPFISSTGLQRLELLGSPCSNTTPAEDTAAHDLQDAATFQTPLAALLLRLPHLHTLAIHTPTLSPADWTALSTLCAANQITELRLNHWRNPEAGPRGLTAFEMPEVHDFARPEDGKGQDRSLPFSPLGLASCLVVKATLLHPAQLPLILGPFGQASSSCRLRVLHLAFLETKCTAPGGLQSSGNPRNEEVARSAWSAILGCVHLQELNISRTNMLPLTDGVMSQLPEKLPMLEVLQYNGYLDVQGPGYHHLARLPLLSTLAMGSNQAPGSPSQTEFHLQLWQLPQQLQCLSLLNAVMHSHPGGIAGFPPGLRQLSLKFCRLVNSLNAHDSSQGAQKASDTCRMFNLISHLPSLMSLHISGANEMAEPGKSCLLLVNNLRVGVPAALYPCHISAVENGGVSTV